MSLSYRQRWNSPTPDRQQNINRLQPVCYLIHFERPYRAKTGKQKQQAQHYLGWTINLPKRVKLHAMNRGARLLAVANAEGIGWSVVRIWDEGSFCLEKKLKARHKHADLCPICNQKYRNLLPKEPLGTRTIPIDSGIDDCESAQDRTGPDESLASFVLSGL